MSNRDRIKAIKAGKKAEPIKATRPAKKPKKKPNMRRVPKPDARKQGQIHTPATTLDARLHLNVDPLYLRQLIAASGFSIAEASRRIGVNERTMRNYVSVDSKFNAEYPVQIALECLAGVR